jgi:cytochrome c-type biogenesis protein CcmH/NrfG
MGKTFLNSLVRNPTSVAILVLSLVIVLVWLDMRQQGPHSDAMPGAPVGMMKPAGPGMGQAQPRIMQQFGAENATPGEANGGGAAPSLDGLVAGLEAKVKEDPSNLSNRLLLAQTYKELGMRDKALKEMRTLQTDNPEQGRVRLILASLLSQSDDEKEITESLALLDKLSSDSTVKSYLVNLYKGDAMMHRKDVKAAVSHWQKALAEMPKQDNRYAMLEKQILDNSAKLSKTKSEPTGAN